jgi:2-polyprenyl-6-methoxyphenol hydroxylase-like FAD-dependent oxidoreductase
MPSDMGETEILIVGAGPTGLMLALELSLQAIPFRIIDSAPQRMQQSRAHVMHARTLELLTRHGVTDELISLGKKTPGVRMYTNQKFVFEVDYQDLYQDTEYSNPLLVSQAKTEMVLEKALAGYGVQVERPVKAEQVSKFLCLSL